MKRLMRRFTYALMLGVLAVGLLPWMAQSMNRTVARTYLPFLANNKSFIRSFEIRGIAPRPLILVLERLEGASIQQLAYSGQRDGQVYRFSSVPLLQPNQQYRVSYYNGQHGNTYDINNVAIYHSAVITESLLDSSVSVGWAAVDGMDPQFPSDIRQVALPYWFEWYIPGFGQPATLRFYDSDGALMHEVTAPDEDNFHITELPAGMEFNQPYDWEVSMLSGWGKVIDLKRRVIFVEDAVLLPPSFGSEQCYPSPYGRPVSCDFEWETLDGATEYYIDIQTTEYLSLPGEGWLANNTWSRGLQALTYYRWRVKARNEVTESSWSPWWVLLTPDHCTKAFC